MTDKQLLRCDTCGKMFVRKTKRTTGSFYCGRECSDGHRATGPNKSLYRWIVDYKTRNDGNSPTIREIVDAGLASSTSVASYNLDKLQAAGLIVREAKRSSHIVVVGGTWTPPE